MYTDDFDELHEAEKRPSRTYISATGQDSGKLQRENERLKKSLEKEQFFNRLLDQELKDLKSSQAGGSGYDPVLFNGPSGVSQKTFNFLLGCTLALAAFTGYTLYFNKQYNLFSQQPVANSENAATKQALPSSAPSPLVTDSVPNIIAEKKTRPVMQQNSAVSEKKPSSPSSHSSPSSQSVQSAKPETKTVNMEKPAADQAEETSTEQASVITSPAPVAQTPVEQQVIAKYAVSSKANFYSAPDGNTLRSYFISPGPNKVVNALEEKNGFIYVEFKNDVGYVTKGWLSKADLVKQ